MRCFCGILLTCFLFSFTSVLAQGLDLRLLGTYESGVFDESAAEVISYDAGSKRLFVINANAGTVDVLDLSIPANPTKISTLEISSFGAGVNSVAVHNGVVAVAVEADPKQNPGRIVFFDTDGNVLNDVAAGALPDMVTFTPDGNYTLAANEGEPSDDYTNDPEGTVTIVDLRQGVASASTHQVSFASFNSEVESLRSQGVRIFGPNASVAQDLEPEYIAVSPDSRTAYVAFQENSAFAIIDIATATVTSIKALGFKDHALPRNAFDASNRDDGINIKPWPTLGMYQPDAIAAFEIDGETYIASANEGDARDYDGYSEETRVKDLVLDATAFPDAETLQDDANLGRLKTTTAQGDTDGDGDYDIIYSYGARSFSIWDASGNLVFDSGSDFENITARRFPDLFNSQGSADSRDERSDDKGPEPEAIAIGKIGDRTYAFIGMERVGGVFAYDITVPEASQFVTYVRNPNDIGPESLIFISEDESPSNNALVVVSSEVSGTVSVYQVISRSGADQQVTLNVTLTQNGSPLSGVSVEIGRSIAGKRTIYQWRGITGDNGQTSIRVSTPRLSGYYAARAIDSSGNVLDTWTSIPLNPGRQINITLPVGGSVTFASLTASNFPNPFNPETVIAYQIFEPGDVSLVIYNVLGQEVRSLVSVYQMAGPYQVRWDGRNNNGQAVASGRYVYHLKTAQGEITGRMVLLK